MTCPYYEIVGESRQITLSRTSMEERFSLEFQLPDPDSQLEFEEYEFYGDGDDIRALQYAYTLTPLVRWMPDMLGNPTMLVLTDMRVAQKNNNDIYSVELTYTYDFEKGIGSTPGSGGDDSRPPEEIATLPYVKITFNTGGATEHITESLQVTLIATSTIYGRPAPDTGRAIGVGAKGEIAGYDRLAAGLSMQVTAYYFPQFYTMDFVNDVAGLTTKYNDSLFMTRPAGEVLLAGVSGGGTVVDIIPITFDFIFKQNLTDETDPQFPDLTMLGHDIVDYRYDEYYNGNADTVTMRPVWRFVHRIYEPGDYTELLLPPGLYL